MSVSQFLVVGIKGPTAESGGHTLSVHRSGYYRRYRIILCSDNDVRVLRVVKASL